MPLFGRRRRAQERVERVEVPEEVEEAEEEGGRQFYVGITYDARSRHGHEGSGVTQEQLTGLNDDLTVELVKEELERWGCRVDMIGRCVEQPPSITL